MIIGCMCVYQEADCISEALASLRAAGCERLVVVDGAWRWFERYGDGPQSTDGTVEIARAAGAEVIEAPAAGWDSEVASRNSYLVGEPGDWYLFLDADERVTGTLPPVLDAAEGAYQLAVMRSPGEAPVRRIRLVQETGSLRYQYMHWALYRDNRLIDQAALLDAVAIEHVVRPGDTDRRRRKADWYVHSSARERAFLVMGWAPLWAVEVSDMERIAYRYIGEGAWIPGLPARDLLEFEAAAYAETLEANLQSSRPIYEKETEISVDVTEPEPVPEAEQPQKKRRQQEDKESK